jgi:peptidoglycan-associated lipoprotein
MNLSPVTNPMNQPRSSSLRLTSLLIPCVALALATGCHKQPKTIQSQSQSQAPTEASIAPPTATITADPLAVELGGTVVLNWRTTNATIATIDGIGQVPVNGTQTVSPSNSTLFHLVAKGDGGLVDANVRVTVRAAEAPVSKGTTYAAPPTSTAVSDSEFHAAVADMFFDYDSFELRADAQTAAAQAAAFLVQHPDIKVLIGGYADERGSAEYNLALGENRANAAKTGLVNAGVAPTRIRVISYGKEKQFCTESTEACWQENRRAQFTIDR